MLTIVVPDPVVRSVVAIESALAPPCANDSRPPAPKRPKAPLVVNDAGASGTGTAPIESGGRPVALVAV